MDQVVITVTSEMVWEKLNQTPGFLQQPEPAREIARPYFEASPQVLADHLEKEVTLLSLMQAKIAFASHLLESDFVEKSVEAMEAHGLLFLFSPEEIAADLKESLEELALHGDKLIEGTLAYVEEWGLSEADVILGAQVGLNMEARELYGKGELTIGKLLELDPWAILGPSKG